MNFDNQSIIKVYQFNPASEISKTERNTIQYNVFDKWQIMLLKKSKNCRDNYSLNDTRIWSARQKGQSIFHLS